MPRGASTLLLPCLLLAGCVSGPATPVPPPTATAFSCAESGTIRTEKVDDVTEIRIYLPPCFDEHRAAPYPVLYLIPAFSGNAYEWIFSGFAKMADVEILGDGIPPFLAVSMEDLFPDINADLVREKILPWVESHFPAGGNRRLRAAAGASFGGAVAYHLVFKNPDLFANAGVFGNGAAYGEEDSIRAWLAAIPALERPRVFINCGEKDTYMTERAKVLLSILDAAGIAHMEIFGPGGHDDETWLANFPAFLRWVAADWEAQTHAE